MDITQRISLSTAREGDQVVVRACGELDFIAAPELKGTVEAAIDDAAVGCVLDCEEVTFIDSESLKCFLALRRWMSEQGKGFYLRNCSRQVARALAMIGLESMFICPSTQL